MLRKRLTHKKFAIVGGLLAVAVFAGGAVATVISQELLVDRASAQIRVVRTEADGFDSGWHTHPGPVVVQVHEGSFKIYQGTCRQPTIVGPGETYIESPYLPVRGVATGHVKWTASLIVPADTAFTTPTSDPCSD